jgi:hypothetical protein
MSASITPSDDGSYVDVFVQIAFKRFGGRKVIVAPDGTPVVHDRSKAAVHLDQGAGPSVALAEAT